MPALALTALLAVSAALPAQPAAAACKTDAPCYAVTDVVNQASNLPGQPLAAMTWATLYGTALSYNTRGRSSEDVLPGFAGVNILVNGQAALLAYVSPSQVHFLIPVVTVPKATIQLTREGIAGPAIELTLEASSPALFQADASTAVAANPDWTLISHDSPAHPGDYAILYATGLGACKEPVDDTLPAPAHADPIVRRSEFKILLDGGPVEDSLIEYAGAAPGMYGIYQINLKLPKNAGKNPEIRLSLGGAESPAGLHLPVQ